MNRKNSLFSRYKLFFVIKVKNKLFFSEHIDFPHTPSVRIALENLEGLSEFFFFYNHPFLYKPFNY